MSGYIRLHRKIRKNPLFRKNLRARVLFEDILMDAAWKDTVQDWRGKPITVRRGQLMMSTREMAREYDLTHRQVRTLLKSLETHNMLKIDTVNVTGPMLVTVCNYSEYQEDRHSGDTQSDTAATQPRHTKEKREEIEKTNTKPRERETVDLNTLADKLRAAAGSAMSDVTAAMSMDLPMMWLDRGADLDRDILPAIAKCCRGKPPGSIQSWKYFHNAVADAKREREALGEAFAKPENIIGGIKLSADTPLYAMPADDPYGVLQNAN